MTKEELTTCIADKFPGKLERIENKQAEPYFILRADALVEFSRFIHDDDRLQMTFLMNMSAVDAGDHFEIVYNVCSYRLRHRLYFKIILGRSGPEFETVISIWPAANWFEREIWELFGINVKGHPNLTRFLLPEDWDDGHPMRKDWVGKNVVPLPEVKS